MKASQKAMLYFHMLYFLEELLFPTVRIFEKFLEENKYSSQHIENYKNNHSNVFVETNVLRILRNFFRNIFVAECILIFMYVSFFFLNFCKQT